MDPYDEVVAQAVARRGVTVLVGGLDTGKSTLAERIARAGIEAGIPVVLKDIKQDLVDAGLTEARNVTTGQIGKLAEKGKISQEQPAGVQ